MWYCVGCKKRWKSESCKCSSHVFRGSHDIEFNLLYSPSKCQGIRQVRKKGSPCRNQHNGGARFVLLCFGCIEFLFCFVWMHEGCKMEKLQQMKEINSKTSNSWHEGHSEMRIRMWLLGLLPGRSYGVPMPTSALQNPKAFVHSIFVLCDCTLYPTSCLTQSTKGVLTS